MQNLTADFNALCVMFVCEGEQTANQMYCNKHLPVTAVEFCGELKEDCEKRCVDVGLGACSVTAPRDSDVISSTHAKPVAFRRLLLLAFVLGLSVIPSTKH